MSKMRLRQCACWALAGVLAATLGACDKQMVGRDGKPRNIQFVVDTGPGGGSDMFARQIVKLARENRILQGNWPVLSRPQGGGLAAMNFLGEKAQQPGFIAAFTSKWVSSGYITPTATTTVKDLTVIAMLADEQQMVAVPADSPYHTFADFVEAARKNPGQLVQVGGAYSSVDNLAALQIQKNTGTRWKYLSFADGGPRITALLRGDAQIMLGAQNDFAEQVAAGQMKIIGVLGNVRAHRYPAVTTLAEQGIPMQRVPPELQFRGIAGPPGMKPDAVAYYRDFFARLVKTPGWEKYMEEEGDRTQFVTGAELEKKMAAYNDDIRELVKLLNEKS